MKSMTRQTLPGPFAAVQSGPGVWHLTTGVPDGPEVYLRGTGPEAAKNLKDERITALDLLWRGDGVTVTVTGAGGVRHFETMSALVHRPVPRLYESLPLASFDSDAQRFWKWVFRLLKFPGGRMFLGLIARRNRGRRGPASQ